MPFSLCVRGHDQALDEIKIGIELMTYAKRTATRAATPTRAKLPEDVEAAPRNATGVVELGGIGYPVTGYPVP